MEMSSTSGGEEVNNEALRLSSGADDRDEYRHHNSFNDRILYLTNMFGLCLQLNNGGGGGGGGSGALPLALSLYTATLAAADVQTRSNIECDPAEAEFTSNITVVCGTLVLTIQLFLLVPAFGWLALVSWIINLVRVFTISWGYLKRLYQTKVAAAISQVVSEYETLKELIVRCLGRLKIWRDGGDTAHETEEEINGRP